MDSSVRSSMRGALHTGQGQGPLNAHWTSQWLWTEENVLILSFLCKAADFNNYNYFAGPDSIFSNTKKDFIWSGARSTVGFMRHLLCLLFNNT